MTQDPPDNQQLTEVNWSNGVSTPGYTNVRTGGQLIAHYDLSGSQPALYFHFGDWLGTLRVITDAAGNVSPNGQTCIKRVAHPIFKNLPQPPPRVPHPSPLFWRRVGWQEPRSRQV